MQEFRMKRIFKILLVGITTFLLTSFYGVSQEKWELVKDDEQIKVYLNKNNKKDRMTHVKATSITEGSLNEYYELLREVNKYKT